MYSLYRLLFKNNYWRMVLRKDTWREARLSFKRAHKDKRARKHLLGIALLLLIPVLCVLYAAWVVGTGALVFVPFVIPVIWWRNRRAKQDDVLLHITPGSKPAVKELTEEERQDLRRYFARLALFYAVMVDRAGSESFLKQKVLPEGFEVTSRRVHLELLRAHGLWDQMDRRDRELVMMPDGHWEWWQINQVSVAIEQVRLLRWILRKDFYLPVIGQQLRGNYQIAHELVHAPDKVLDAKELAEMSMLRTGKEAADDFFFRCWAEGISRGYYTVEDEEATEWANSVADRLRDKQHEDFVLGEKLVSEVSEEELRLATSLSGQRRVFLGWVMAVMDKDNVPQWQMSVFPAEEVEEPATEEEGV